MENLKNLRLGKENFSFVNIKIAKSSFFLSKSGPLLELGGGCSPSPPMSRDLLPCINYRREESPCHCQVTHDFSKQKVSIHINGYLLKLSISNRVVD